MNITEELLQARNDLSVIAGNDANFTAAFGNHVGSVLFRAANTIQTLEQQIKDSEATATRYAEVVAGRTATLRYLSISHGRFNWMVVDTERQIVVAAECTAEHAANIAALLNKA